MVNEEKIKIMTKMASYEANLGKKDLEIVKRMKSDYISYNGFVTCLMASIAVLILLGAHFAHEFLNNMATFSEFDFVGEGVNYLAIWILVVAVFGFVSGRIYRKEYDDAYKRVKEYEKQLKHLDDMSK